MTKIKTGLVLTPNAFDDTKSIHQNVTALRGAALDPALVPVAGELVHPFFEALDDDQIFTPPNGEQMPPGESATTLLTVVKKIRAEATRAEEPNSKFLTDLADEIEHLVQIRDTVRRP